MEEIKRRKLKFPTVTVELCERDTAMSNESFTFVVESSRALSVNDGTPTKHFFFTIVGGDNFRDFLRACTKFAQERAA